MLSKMSTYKCMQDDTYYVEKNKNTFTFYCKLWENRWDSIMAENSMWSHN